MTIYYPYERSIILREAVRAKMAAVVADVIKLVEGVYVIFKDTLHADLNDVLSCIGLFIGSPAYF